MQPPCTPLQPDAPADVHVWRVDIALDAPLDAAAGNVLQAHEMERAGRFLRHHDAVRFTTMRAALRRLLASMTHADAAHLTFDTDAHGRPKLAMRDAPDFNVSHSGAHGLIAISRARRVGVDIEEARLSFDWRGLETSVLHDADARAIDALPQGARSGAWFACWTAKEAVLKAQGEGIGGEKLAMPGFSVLPLGGARRTRFALSKEAGSFDAVPLAAPAGYAAALAWSTE
ncbi:4'-phosphopantetheinyl transferase superfamily protein [Caballeronia sp. Lep1P3]|uniref:4'-phosphopantetheinyl transferase family protein n=1 Tax=Caballeronia sp. Lep1P3 TaxID=2878150 RepID=UPI001FCFB8F7|nr:4'-phosphopantetheinyl transferase superfamily protein [Caballeronia sp. Lep1P3]